ncbi:MAG: zinc-ribbon domain-containing protein [Clostridia bacterium]|nr:zinc-ribbon domain-containing protein [Clostridia bacterium]
MFCPKCGMELPDGSQFCPACGAQLGAQTPAATEAAKPAGNAAGAFKLPDVYHLIVMGWTLLVFIFGFLPLFGYSYDYGFGYSGSESFSILHSHMFDANVLLGFAKIFMIISIIIFVVYIVSQFIDFNQLLKIPFNVAEKSTLAYYCVYAVSMLFTLIGAIIESGFHPAACWYIATILCAAGFFLILKPDLVKSWFSSIKK